MPTYDYQCNDCGGFEARRNVSERDDTIGCPDCSKASVRVMARHRHQRACRQRAQTLRRLRPA
jgi:putative FmdB family regulatory protein